MFSEHINSSFQHHVVSSLINRNTGYHGGKKKKTKNPDSAWLNLRVCMCVLCGRGGGRAS